MKAKVPVLVAIVLTLMLAAHSAQGASASLNDLQLTIVDVSYSGDITVRMSNSSSQKPLRVWKESNSWGALRWRVLVLRKGKPLVAFEDTDEVLFTKNIAIPEEIAVGSHIDRKLNVNGKYWSKAWTGELRFEPGDQLVVVYDVPPEVEAQKMQVWYGVTAAVTTVK
jgi:hypothetical protein